MRLSLLAARAGATFSGVDDPDISGVAPPRTCGPSQLTLALDVDGLGVVADAAGAVVLPSSLARDIGRPVVHGPNPRAVYARIAAMFESDDGLDARPVCGRDVTIGRGARFGPGVVLGDRVRVGDFARIGANTVVGAGSSIGHRTVIGPLTSIGHAPFDLAFDGGHWIPVPGVAGVVIADDCRIGARCTIAAGCARPTTLGTDVVLDDGVHVGHDAVVGAHSALASGVLVGGYVTLGARCKIGGAAAIAEGVSVADGVTVTAMTGVAVSVAIPGTRLASGWPGMPARQWWRLVSRVRRSVDDESK